MRIADMHCDTIGELLRKEREGSDVSLRHNDLHLDLERMAGAGYVIQNFALFVPISKVEDPWQELLSMEKLYREELCKNSDLIVPVTSYEELEQNCAGGKMSAMLTVEDGGVCAGSPERLEALYAMGVRMVTLTWNHSNELGISAADAARGGCSSGDTHGRPGDGTASICDRNGLTKRGHEFVRRMEELGMIVDVSHLSDAGVWDLLDFAQTPFVASHSDARAVHNHFRNLPDELIRRIGQKGGCIGLNFYTDFLGDEGSMAAACAHAKQIVNVGGEAVLGLGSDFDGIDTNPWIPGVQSMEKLWCALHRAGFTQRQLEKIFCENVLRLYREIL